MERKITFNEKSVMSDGVMSMLEILLEKIDFTEEEFKKMEEAKDRFGIKIFKV